MKPGRRWNAVEAADAVDSVAVVVTIAADTLARSVNRAGNSK
jgi:hypothetical protein